MTRTSLQLKLMITKRFILRQRQQVPKQPLAPQVHEEIQQDPVPMPPIQQPRARARDPINNEPVFAPDNLNAHLREDNIIKNPILRAVDLAMRHGIADLAEVSLSCGIILARSEELAAAYVENLKAADAIAKKLDEAQHAPWIPAWVQKLIKTWVIGSVSFVSIAFFLYKAWQLGMIPDFTGKAINIVGHLMQPVTQGVRSNIQDIPKPNITAAFQTFAETPLAPITILAFVGAAGIGMGVLKLMLMIIQRAPK